MRLTKPLLWLLTLLWFALGIWWYSTSSCTSCNETAATNPESPLINANLPGFSVSDGSWNLSTANNLRFGKSAHIPLLGADITTLMDSLVGYSKANPTRKITVMGYYTAAEKNSTSFENLGLARADELKKILVSKGVNAANIFTDSKLDDVLSFSPADTLVGGITMAITNLEDTKPKGLFDPRTVYFKTGQNTLNVDAELKDYLVKATAYLKANTDKKLMVTGHTDNVGDPAKNVTLSANRAVFVKSELIKQGMLDASIETEGKGMAEPIADNNTTEGKAKNRRVTIQLK
jgi:OmpA-OmpF porin, OOP family